MLKGKERKYLKAMANSLRPIIQIGKEGVSEQFLAQLDNMFNDHELIKISVLNNNELDTKETANEICDIMKSDFISAIGSKIVVYRESRTKDREDRIKIPK